MNNVIALLKRGGKFIHILEEDDDEKLNKKLHLLPHVDFTFVLEGNKENLLSEPYEIQISFYDTRKEFPEDNIDSDSDDNYIYVKSFDKMFYPTEAKGIYVALDQVWEDPRGYFQDLIRYHCLSVKNTLPGEESDSGGVYVCLKIGEHLDSFKIPDELLNEITNFKNEEEEE